MEKYTIQQRVDIVKMYYQNLSSVRQTFLKLRGMYGQHDRPTESANNRKNLKKLVRLLIEQCLLTILLLL